MKPSQFHYHRPPDLETVFELLEAHSDAELVAGNQSLGIVMSNRMATPDHLIDLDDVDELRYLTRDEETVQIGAMITHREIERSQLLAETVPMLPEAAEQIAGPSVRNRGTLGGSLAEADPAGNYPTALLALDGTLHLRSAEGSRRVPAEEFYIAYMFTDLREDEVIELVTVPMTEFPPDRSGMAFDELKPSAQTWPTISAAAAVRVDDPTADDPVVERARVALANAADTPLLVDAVEDIVEGGTLSDEELAAAADAATDAAEPQDELHADAEYKTEVAGEYTRIALTNAYENAKTD